MKKVILIFLVLFSQLADAQKHSVQAVLWDSLSVRAIPFVSVSLLAADSTLLSSTRSGMQGQVAFKRIDSGQYILLFAHPKYLGQSKRIRLQRNKDLGKVYLMPYNQLLSKVVIRDKKAILIQGDTITFAADSFQTKDGAVVEDLIKLLPGMEVDENGAITNQGKQVERVLVNGEEFFGNDPTVATKNLPSKAIDKVEVYDSKDAQEQFTGFVADKDTKVINLKLKKEYNRGLLGKVGSATNTQDRWAQQLMLNRFADKEQMSAYYLSSSNGNASMGMNDAGSYGGETGGTNSSAGDPFRNGLPWGITKSWKGGARYANKFPNKNQELNISVGSSRSTQDRQKSSYTENLLPNTTLYKVEAENNQREGLAHALNLRYKIKTDSTLAIEYEANISVNTANTLLNKQYQNAQADQQLISFNTTNFSAAESSTNTRNTLSLNKKLGKEGRTLSIQTTVNTRQAKSNGILSSTNAIDLLNGGSTINLYQQKDNSGLSRNWNSSAVFTEAISETLKLKVQYQYTDLVNNTRNITSDTIGFGIDNFYRQLDSLSTIFNTRQISHQPGFELRYEKNDWRISLENDVAFTRFIQKDALRNNDFNYQQFNLLPSISLRYNLSKYKRVNVRYNGRTQMPSASQLQPFQDNSNPLNVIVGNPNLRMSYYQRVSVSFSSYAPIEGHNTYIGISAGNGINQIGTSRFFDETGRTITTYLNLPNNYNAGSWGSLSRRITGTFYTYRIGFNGNYQYSPNVINNISGQNEQYQFSLTPSLRYFNNDLLSFNANCNVAFSQSVNTGNTNRSVQFWSISPGADISFFFPHYFTWDNILTYQYTPAVGPYITPFSRLYYHPSLSKQLLPGRNLIIRIEVLDVFNQNQGYDRSNNVNYNTESFYNTLGRYWQIGANWNFFNGPAKSQPKKKSTNGDTGKGWIKKKSRDE